MIPSCEFSLFDYRTRCTEHLPGAQESQVFAAPTATAGKALSSGERVAAMKRQAKVKGDKGGRFGILARCRDAHGGKRPLDCARDAWAGSKGKMQIPRLRSG